MPSITIRFDWDQTLPYPEGHDGRALAEMSSYLQRQLTDAYGPLIDETTLDAVIDDGRGITHTDRAAAAVDDEHEAKARSRAEEE